MAILLQVERDLAMFELIFKDRAIAKSVAEYFSNSQNLGRILGLNCLDSANNRAEFEVALKGGIRAIEQSYKLMDDGIFESHKKYVDFQFVARGSEVMKVGFMSNFVALDRYDEKNDVINYTAIAAPSLVRLYEGDLLILAPRDIHAGGFKSQSEVVFKSVLKVPLDLLKMPL